MQDVNPKIFAMGYDENFLINAAPLILLNVLAWILSSIFGCLKEKWTSEWGAFTIKIFHYNLLIIVFFMTANDITMLSFYHL